MFGELPCPKICKKRRRCRSVQILDRAKLRGFSIVETQHATEAVAAFNSAFGERNNIRCRDQSIVYALMIPLSKIMGHVILDGTTQRGLTKEDNAAKRLFLDGTYEALGVGIQIWRFGWQSYDLNTVAFKEPPKGLGIPIDEEIAFIEQEALDENR